MRHIGYIVIEEDRFCVSDIGLEFLGIRIGIILQHYRSTIKPISSLNLHSGLHIISNIDIDVGIVRLLIDLLDHIRNLSISIGGSVSDSTDIGEIPMRINGMHIVLLRILQSIHDFNFRNLKIFQEISLTIFLETFIPIHCPDKLIRCNDRSGGSISHLTYKTERDGLDKGEETIGQGIGKYNTIGNTPSILSGITIRTIINDGCMRIRT